MNILSSYLNGNYKVLLFNNGTKMRIQTKENEEFQPELPESIDLCISHKCSFGCPFCYNNSTRNGNYQICDDAFENLICQLHPGMEVAIGGGSLSEMPAVYLIKILRRFFSAGVYSNITVNARELLNNRFFELLTAFISKNYVNGIGVSFVNNEQCKEKLLELKHHTNNIVVHTIFGITTEDDYEWLIANKFKTLILGFKNCGRGKTFEINKNNQEWIKNNMDYLMSNLPSLSFDCLAVNQIQPQNYIDKEKWDSIYMGDDGKFTMYIDAVNWIAAKSSTESESNQIKINTKSRDFVYKIFNSFKEKN